MNTQNKEITVDNRLSEKESHRYMSDTVLIEIVHGIKEIVLAWIDKKYQVNTYKNSTGVNE